jgi:hypothetical protein
LLLLAILFPAYAVLTDIFILQPISSNPNLKPFEASLILLAAFFASLGFTIASFQIYELKILSKKEAGGMLGSSAGAGIGGSLLGIFASACTICQPVWLAWLGLGAASAFLVGYSIYIILASLAVLLFSIHLGLKAVVQGCAVRRRK